MATEAQDFVAKHNYEQGTYENKLASQGYNVGELLATNKYGRNINPGEYQQIIGSIQSPLQQQRQKIQQGLTDLTSRQFQFDLEGARTAAQAEASSVFSPQKSQLEAIRQLQSSQAAETRLTTEEQFDKQLQAEIESINRRGAYFSGGAIAREQEIGDLSARALHQLDLQASAANFGNLAQQAQLTAQEALYVKDRIFNDRSSAYNVFLQERGFDFDVLQTQYQQYQDEKNFARSVFESDRSFNQEERQFKQQFELSEQKFEFSQKQYQDDIRRYDEETAWEKFKYNNRNTGTTTEEDAKKYAQSLASGVVAGDYGQDYETARDIAMTKMEIFYGEDYKDWDSLLGEMIPLDNRLPIQAENKTDLESQLESIFD